MTLPYTYQATPRRPATALWVAAIWTVLALAWIYLEAAVWIVLLLAAFTLPALYDLVRNPAARFSLDRGHIRWHTTRSEADIAVKSIDHLRLDTRLDMSVRVSVVLASGRKLRVPVPATPPHRDVEAAAHEAGLKVMRHHFSLIG